jgi:uncharacterized lipoprotein YajG
MATLICRLALSMAICLTFVSCAFTTQTAVLDAEIEMPESNEGGGSTVHVKVVDERPDKGLGHRGTAYGKGAPITTEQDMESLILEELLTGLAKKGFTPMRCGADNEPNLKVEIRLFKYSTSTGFWTGGIHTKAAFKVFADAHGNTYEKMYRVDNEDRVVVVPTAETNQEYLNKLLTDVLLQLFEDRELISTLAK